MEQTASRHDLGDPRAGTRRRQRVRSCVRHPVASRERAVLGQPEVGFAAIPGGGPATRLPGLVGRGRAFEILLGGEDFDGALAEGYGYVNRAIPDVEFEGFVDRFVRRVSTFDRQALHDIKHFVNKADRKSTRLNSSHLGISYAVFCLKKKNTMNRFSSSLCFVRFRSN